MPKDLSDSLRQAEDTIQSLQRELLAARTTISYYQQIFDSVPAIICVKNSELRYEMANQHLANAFATTVDALIGKVDADFSATPQEQEIFSADDRDVLHTQTLKIIPEERLTYADGSVHWLTTIKAPLFDKDGTCHRLAVIAMDISEHKRTQIALDDQIHLFNTMLDNLPIGIFMVGASDGKPLLANSKAFELLGRGIIPNAAKENLSAVYHAFIAGTSELYPTENLPLVRGMRGEAHHVDDMEVVRPDGTRRLLEVYGSPVLDSRSQPWASLVGFFDITERKQAEANHRRLEQHSQHTQKLESLGVLAGGIAHDFNNILMAVLGHAELCLSKMPEAAPGRENIQEIERAAGRAAELCRQMLAYAGKASFASETLNMGELIDEMSQLLKASISKKAVLQVYIEKGLAPILADPSQIRQIVLNLIINASDALGENNGVITVSAGMISCDNAYMKNRPWARELLPGLYNQLEITDTGMGMTDEVRMRIFEPFFTTKFTGRGLGLAAVLGIVKAHRGAISVSSAVGQGTSFTLLFPAAAHQSSAPSSPSVIPQLWRGQGTILLVDDEESLRWLGADMLSSLGYSVLTAEDGVEAVAMYRQHADDIRAIILDLTMPRMDGLETFTELRRINPHATVILASGYSSEDVAARFMGKGLTGVLQKPYSINKLKQSLAFTEQK